MSKATFAARLLAGAAGAALLLAAGSAAAQDRPTDPSTIDILQVLVEKGVLSQGDADAVLSEARRRAEDRPATVRVPYVPEAVRDSIKEEVRVEVLETARKENWAQPDALPDWLERISFNGDVRVRSEWKNFGDGNTPAIYNVTAIRSAGGISANAIPPLLYTKDGRYRARVRARFGVDAKLNDSIEAGLRFVSGDVSDPVSTNETLSPNFDKIDVGLDRAYIRLSPFRKMEQFKRFSDTSVWLGKFDNPFFSTEIMWDRDVQFDGAAITSEVALGDGPTAPRLFGAIGAFPLDELASKVDDKTLFAAQIGGVYAPTDRVTFRLAGTFYDFHNVQSEFNTTGTLDNDETAPRRTQYGNSVFNIRRDNGPVNTLLLGLASKYQVAALTGRAEFRLTDKLQLAIDAEGLFNTAFEEDELPLYGVPGSSGDKAWHLRGTIGHPSLSDTGAWQLSAGWRYVEADATLDLFTDSDFGVGGTDQEGFVIKAGWAFTENLAVEANWSSARTIDLIDIRTGARALSVDTDTAQVDLLVKF